MEKLTEAALQARREYMRAWRANNADKVREHARRYWEKRAASREEGRNEYAEKIAQS